MRVAGNLAGVDSADSCSVSATLEEVPRLSFLSPLSFVWMRVLAAAVSLGFLATAAQAQQASLRGTVSDPGGAVVPGAQVALKGPRGVTRSAEAGPDGTYSFAKLAPGEYTLAASAPQLAMAAPVKVSLGTATKTVDLVLSVVAEKQQVTVEDKTAGVSTEAAANASATVIKGADLDALSDNADDLAADLAALAGPAAGPSGGGIYIDGFSGGQIPPKGSIREIRINQNPFSPEYDKLGFGRIEILTKPGTGSFHGDLGYNIANDALNSRNPYAAQKAPFRLHELREGISGSLSKKSSFALNAVREWVDNGNAVNGVVLDAQLRVTPFTATPVAQLRRTVITPRVDYQVSANNTLSVRYTYSRDIVRNAGTGSLNLSSRGYHYDLTTQTAQVSDTQVLGANTINETRFQYFRPVNTARANTPGAAIDVAGAFQAGGNPIGQSRNLQNNYELQNITTRVHRAHTIRAGLRLRVATATDIAPQNYAGTFTFAGGEGPALDALGNVIGASAPITSIERYRRTLLLQQLGFPPDRIRSLGGGASQFTQNTGDPSISGNQTDLGLFFADDWRAKPNLTLSLGLRVETQNNISARANLGPRFGLAWAPRRSARAKTVIRAGSGLFYDRFALGNVLTARRFNGLTQRQIVVDRPDFFTLAPAPNLMFAGSTGTIQQLSATLQAPSFFQTAVSLERQLPANTTIAITYANTRGSHVFRSRDLNAPLNGVYPFTRPGMVVQYESSGTYKQNQLLLNLSTKATKNISLTGTYGYGRARSDTDGLSTFPANPYSFAGEYGPASTDIRHRGTLAGSINLKYGVRLNPLFSASSGPPFNIITGGNLYGDTIFNVRPGLASALGPGVVQTAYGLLDLAPKPGEAILARNFGRGPGQVMLNLRISRTFTFGSSERHAPAPVSASGGAAQQGNASGAPFPTASSTKPDAAASRKYGLTASLQVRNLTNHNNPGPIIGNLASPLFGQANQPAASGNPIFSESANNRRLELQIRLTF
ncbi:MAG: carboxypeptidase regulatory-like domain-containing protein [Bryobacteraceae bacterium]